MNNINTYFSKLPVFNLGFRLFFLGAAIFSIITILFWMGIYSSNIDLPMSGLSPFQWHAHEMIFGYSLAVIVGFLLTAVKNWTGIRTVHGLPLALLFFLWLVARVLFLFGTMFISIALIFDLLFIFSAIIAIANPVIQAKNWKQLSILFILMLFLVFNTLFYVGCLGILKQGIIWGIYGGLYLVITLILIISARVVPFFTERGVDYEVKLYNPKWINISGLLIFLIFFVSELFLQNQAITVIAAAALFVVYSVRLLGWYTNGIWLKPLLWSLHLSLLFINLGFLLFVLSSFLEISKYLAIHSIAFGGIGTITLAMMARVSLGHTGRNTNEPPETVKYLLGIVILGSIVRVVFPLLFVEQYFIWIISSQILWLIAFSIFVITYAPMLLRERTDGQFG